MRSRALVLLLGLVAPGAVQAQSIATLKATAARLQRELDSLRHLPKPVAPMDTLRLPGGWVVATSPEVRALVEAEAPATLADLSAQFGGALVPSVTPVRIEFDSTGSFRLAVAMGDAPAMWSPNSSRRHVVPRGYMARMIEFAYQDAVWHAADPDLQEWSGGSVLGSEFDDLVNAARVRLQRDTGAAASECRNGALAACEQALGGGGHVPEFATVVRMSLLRFALDHAGGDGSLPRLYVDPRAPVLDRLAALDSVPVDTLVARWHRAVIHPDALTAGTSAIALLGAILLIAVAVGRAKWRAV